jgi:hypothetical protein
MTQEEQIEEILLEAHSMGFRNELIELAKNIMEINPTIRRVDAYEAAYNQILFEHES